MPELPEIEVIKLGLQKRIVGLKLTKIQVNSAKSFIGNPNLVEGQKIVKVWRKAKILGMELTGNLTLLFHLKMSGQLVLVGKSRFIGGHPTPDMAGEMPNKHTRVIISFSDGSHLYFNDQRKFGWVRVIENLKFKIENLFGNLGPEPLERDFNWEMLKNNLLKHRNIPVKEAIMDQSVVSGLGNIYANEACFDAKIDPAKLVRELTDEEFKKLYKGVIKSLQDGIKHGGSSRANFVDSEGHKGYYLDYVYFSQKNSPTVYFSQKNSPTVYCYGRNKQECKICSTEIRKISLGGRGTYFCPNCQR